MHIPEKVTDPLTQTLLECSDFLVKAHQTHVIQKTKRRPISLVQTVGAPELAAGLALGSPRDIAGNTTGTG